MDRNGAYQNGFGYHSRSRRENGSAVSTVASVLRRSEQCSLSAHLHIVVKYVSYTTGISYTNIRGTVGGVT